MAATQRTVCADYTHTHTHTHMFACTHTLTHIPVTKLWGYIGITMSVCVLPTTTLPPQNEVTGYIGITVPICLFVCPCDQIFSRQYLLNCWTYFMSQCLVRKLDCCVQGQGHSEGSDCQWMFVQPVSSGPLNHCDQTRYGDALSWAGVHAKRLMCQLQGQGHS